MIQGKLSGVTLTPAYGRDYKSKAEIVAALNKPEDFTANHFTGTTYCSVRDLADGEHMIRYKKLANVAVVVVKGGKAIKAK